MHGLRYTTHLKLLFRKAHSLVNLIVVPRPDRFQRYHLALRHKTHQASAYTATHTYTLPPRPQWICTPYGYPAHRNEKKTFTTAGDTQQIARYRKPIVRLIGLTFLAERFINIVYACAHNSLNFEAREQALDERPTKRVQSAETSGVKMKLKR